MVRAANLNDFKTDITLFVHGIIVSGILVSGNSFFEKLADDQDQKISRARGEEAEGKYGQDFKMVASTYSVENDENRNLMSTQ